jgi:hypothetical protein
MAKHDTHEDTIEREKPVDKTTLPPVDNDIKPPEGLTPAQEAKWEADNPHPAGTDYDAPPKQWVPGTVVPQDTDPADMTDAEYVQWCFENRMPYWAIKKEIYLRKPPVLSGLEPSTAAIGDASFEMKISGEGFIPDSVIVFAGQDEPTTLNEDGTLSTGVNMGVWHGADTVQVCVRNGSLVSEPLDFTFTGGEARKSDEARDDRDHYDPDRDDRDEDDDDRDDDGKPAKKARKKK